MTKLKIMLDFFIQTSEAQNITLPQFYSDGESREDVDSLQNWNFFLTF